MRGYRVPEGAWRKMQCLGPGETWSRDSEGWRLVAMAVVNCRGAGRGGLESGLRAAASVPRASISWREEETMACSGRPSSE
jgi:hypothetical protein